jgi:hypothetical protein
MGESETPEQERERLLCVYLVYIDLIGDEADVCFNGNGLTPRQMYGEMVADTNLGNCCLNAYREGIESVTLEV